MRPQTFLAGRFATAPPCRLNGAWSNACDTPPESPVPPLSMIADGRFDGPRGQAGWSCHDAYDPIRQWIEVKPTGRNDPGRSRVRRNQPSAVHVGGGCTTERSRFGAMPRRRSPVLRCGSRSSSRSRPAWVPLPAPGGPSITRFMSVTAAVLGLLERVARCAPLLRGDPGRLRSRRTCRRSPRRSSCSTRKPQGTGPPPSSAELEHALVELDAPAAASA